MRAGITTTAEILGLVLATAGIALISIPFALIFAGAALITAGVLNAK